MMVLTSDPFNNGSCYGRNVVVVVVMVMLTSSTLDKGVGDGGEVVVVVRDDCTYESCSRQRG